MAASAKEEPLPLQLWLLALRSLCSKMQHTEVQAEERNDAVSQGLKIPPKVAKIHTCPQVTVQMWSFQIKFFPCSQINLFCCEVFFYLELMGKGRITRKNNLSSSSSSSPPVRPQLLQISRSLLSFSFCVGQGEHPQQHYENGHMLLCRPHSGVITGLEANSGKEMEPAFRLTVVVAYDLFGPTSDSKCL